MAEYIEKQSLMDYLGYHAWGKSIPELIRDISIFPAEDVAGIVRCRDCRHYYFAENRIPSQRSMVCGETGLDQNDPDFYCGHAERNEDG